MLAGLAGCASTPLTARWPAAEAPLTLRSDPAFAGAISSLRYRGVEYLDSSDHGRLLQGAISFDGRGECDNPTLAGASTDGRRRGSSRLLAAETGPTRYRTLTRMAYWLRPGQRCAGPGGRPAPAANRTRLSEVLYEQTLTPAWRGLPGAVHHAIVLTTPVPRRQAVVEALTAYTPARFDQVLLFDPPTGRLQPDPAARASPGEQARPAVLATADGSAALALWSPDPAAGYGRFLLPGTSKLNIVFRPQGPYPAGPHPYEAVTLVGSLEEVEAALRTLAAPQAAILRSSFAA